MTVIFLTDFRNIFDWICYVFLIASITTHLVDIFVHSETLARAHIRIMSVTIILLWLRLMKVARAFALLGKWCIDLLKSITAKLFYINRIHQLILLAIHIIFQTACGSSLLRCHLFYMNYFITGTCNYLKHALHLNL